MKPLALAVKRAIARPSHRLLPQLVITSSLCALTGNAQALSFELDNGMSLDLDTTLTYDVQWRMEDRDPTLINAAGAIGLATDDGNRNFDKHDLTQNRVSFSTDLDFNYGDGGVFLRARGWYDDVYNDDGLLTQKNPTNLATGGPNPQGYQQDGIDIHKEDIELLDAFIYHSFPVGERSLSLRVGRQAVNWGESLFLNGGISSAQGPLDATKANSPGVELKDIFLPLGQIYAETDLTDSVSLGAYYQWEWDETRVDAPGTYFSVLDIAGQGAPGDTVDIPVDTSGVGTGPFVYPFGVERDKPDAGQYGVALRYLAENLNNTEFGFYHLRFNDFAPTIQFVPVPGIGLGNNVILEHFEGIDLYGMSFGTVFGDTNVSGEFNFRSGQPVRLNAPGLFYFSEADTLQAQVSVSHIFGETALWDSLTLLAEVGHNRVLSIDDDNLAATLGIDVDDKSSALHGDVSASGFVGRLSADYFSIASGLDLKVSATYRNDFNGVSSVPFTFTEGSEVLGLKADFTYLGAHSFGASYTWFLTDPDEVLKDQGALQVGHFNADRDNLALYYKYRF